MGRGKTKEEPEKTRKPFTSETAREAQKKAWPPVNFTPQKQVYSMYLSLICTL